MLVKGRLGTGLGDPSHQCSWLPMISVCRVRSKGKDSLDDSFSSLQDFGKTGELGLDFAPEAGMSPSSVASVSVTTEL